MDPCSESRELGIDSTIYVYGLVNDANNNTIQRKRRIGMSKNKRVPRELQRYVVVCGNKTAANYEIKYLLTQAEAKEWASKKKERCRLFKIDYDYYGDL
jgi:hypothetical protein